ncbi:zinc ABC transporter substrate-binding protein ZnuA [Candidatus Fukatsuia anoeciicola]|uniref:zinc ABC transporter substrate-binding protein ZnuA n=1 Tax=Candidatus Fukatsuia anoeciicola TaxID=2994492 RepID=UPI003463C915
MLQKKNKSQYCSILTNYAILSFILFVIVSSSQVFAAIVTSIRPLGFIVAAITEGVISTEIQVLLPDGASPHNYALCPSDLQRLHDADLVVWVGMEMEAFLSKPLMKVATNKQIAIAPLAKVAGLLMTSNQHDQSTNNYQYHDYQTINPFTIAKHYNHNNYDMHVWLSPKIARLAAITIHNNLLKLMPQKKNKLDANLRQFKYKLAQSEKNIASILNPIRSKGYFVFHDAYGYFEKQFSLVPLGHFTVNLAIPPGARRLYQIKTQLIKRKAVCIFTESQFKPAIINTITKDINIRIGNLDPLGNGIKLSKDSYIKFLFQLSKQYVSCLE